MPMEVYVTQEHMGKIKVLEEHGFKVTATPEGFCIEDLDDTSDEGWKIISTVPDDLNKCLDDTLTHFGLSRYVTKEQA